jgi:glycosyltransferase involved in cell wall biosynthesis
MKQIKQDNTGDSISKKIESNTLILRDVDKLQLPLSVVIASMNEEKGIGDCLNKINRIYQEYHICGEVIVADNSTDDTSKIAKQFGARVVIPDKLGYGNALIFGINNASGKYIIIGDADDSYNFSDIPRLLDPLTKGQADMVIGSRYKGKIVKGAMPWLHHYVGNPLLTWGLNFRLRTKLSDAHSGLRAFTKKAWDAIDTTKLPQDFCSELLRQMVKNKATITEIPVDYHPRKGTIKAGTLLHGWRCFKFLTFDIFLNN